MRGLAQTSRNRKRWRLVLASLCAAWAVAGCGGEEGGDGSELDTSWQELSSNQAQVKYFSLPVRQAPVAEGKVLSVDAELDVAMGGDGRLAVAWATGVRDPLDRDNPDPPAPEIYASDVHLQIFDAQANAAGPTHVLGSLEPGVKLNTAPRVAMNQAGETFAVWVQHNTNDEEPAFYEPRSYRSWVMSRRYSPSGSPLGPASVLIRRGDAGLGRFGAFTAADGTLLLGFSFGSRLHETEQFMRQLFDSSGNALGPMSTTTRVGSTPDAVAPDGSYAAVTDFTYSESNVARYRTTVQWFAPQGAAVAETVLRSAVVTSMAYGRDGTIYVGASHPDAQWSSSEGFVHRFAQDGKAMGKVSLGPMGSFTDNTHSGIALAQGPDGRLVVAWRGRGSNAPGIRAQMLSEQIEKIGDEMRVDEFHPEYVYFEHGPNLKPRIVAGPNGRFAVVYIIFHESHKMLVGGAVVQP